MQHIYNLCRLAILQLNECNLPPYKLTKTDKGDLYLNAKSGTRVARIWLNGICDEENGKMIESAVNNNFRFASALAIAISKLEELGITEVPEIDNCFSGELNLKMLDKFGQ